MFRRKTDQVYSTLQQVQRRITEQSANADPAVGGTPPSPAVYPFSQIPPAPVSPLNALAAASRPAAETAAATASTPTPPSPARRNVLQLSGELASLLLVVWLVTVVVAFVIGRSYGPNGAADPGAAYAQGPAGSRDPDAAPPASDPVVVRPSSEDKGRTPPSTPPATRPGGYVLVLASVARANPVDEQRLQGDAERLNQYTLQHSDKGIPPWFGVRHPANGGLQLVFGSNKGQFGVDMNQFAAFAGDMQRAGYKDAHWLKVQ